MRKTVLLLLALLLSLSLASACAETRITVTGTGETLIPADTAVVSLGVTVRNGDALEAQASVNRAVDRIRQALMESGIAPEDINTGYVNLFAVYDYSEENTEQITAYSASSVLSIRVEDMSAVGKVIDLAFGAGANTLEGVSFFAKNDTAAREESLRAAVADARAKAEVLAEASGLRITGITEMQEGGVSVYERGTANFAMKAAGEEAAWNADAATVVQSAKISVSSSVTVVFAAE